MARNTTALVFTNILVAVITVIALVAVPRFRVGGGQSQDASCSSKVALLDHELLMLRRDLADARAALAAAQGPAPAVRPLAAAPPRATDGSSVDPILAVDMHELLGTDAYYGGVSFDTQYCATPIPMAFPNATKQAQDELIAKFVSELLDEMAKLSGRERVHLIPTSSWPDAIKPPEADNDRAIRAAMVRDPRTRQWRAAVSGIMSKYMVDSKRVPILKCPEAQAVGALTFEALGTPVCPGMDHHQVADILGYHAVPFAPVSTIAHDAVMYGLCTKSSEMRSSFGEWLRDERMFAPQWKTFDVPSLDQDHVVFLYDVLYEKFQIFKRQYWMGVITMQNPNDLVSISDIIYTTKPDLIIETGTANGGSALLWASIMELANIEGGKVLTLDVAQPSWDPQGFHWGGKPRDDPTAHPLWKKRVTFVQGDAVSEASQAAVKQAVAKANTVLVLLDSSHHPTHVTREMAMLCPLVTVGSYCIVEDTKMSRWSSFGPLSSVKGFLEQHPGQWITDRERELLYTHHAMGYLKRVK